jgi:hypothetical protein
MTFAAEASRVPPRSRHEWFVTNLIRHSVAFLFLTAMIGLIYHVVLIGHASLTTNTSWPPGTPFVGDPAAGGPITLPLAKLTASAWTHLQLPIIDPYQGYGLSLIANQGAPVFPPELLFHLLIPGNYSVWNVVQLLVLAYGCYLLASSFGQSMFAGLAVGTAAALAGIAPPNVNLDVVNAVGVLPYVLLSARYLVDPRSRHPLVASLGLATSVTLLALSGFQEVFPLIAVIIGVFVVALIVHFHTLRLAAHRLTMGAIAVVFGGVAGAVGYLPTLSVVGAGGDLNPANNYLHSYPTYWLATTAMPSLTRESRPSWLLGTPLLVLVLVLAVLIAGRRAGAHLRWLVWPSAALVLMGILGYVDAAHVLDIFGFFPFDIIGMERYLPFVWWLPWCLLLGVVISCASILRWYHVMAALGVAALFDLWTLSRYRDAVAAAHLTSDLKLIDMAVVATAIFLCIFAAGVAISGHVIGAVVMTASVIASCVYYLPTNFFPSAGDQAVTTISSTALPARTNDYDSLFLNEIQLPVKNYSAQLFGQIDPKSYVNILDALVPPTATSNGQTPIYIAAPSLYYAKLDSHLIAVLRFMGIDRIVSPTPLSLPTIGVIPACLSVGPQPRVCLAARGETRGVSQVLRLYVYSVPNADALVYPASRVVSLETNGQALSAAVVAIRQDKDLATVPAYVAQPTGNRRLALGVSAVSRSATTEEVHVQLHARSGGLVVLRDSYAPGMTVSDNGRQEPALSVDGGLWTALEVPKGTSHVLLDYVTRSDVLEFVACGLGIALLAILWCLLGAFEVRSRIARTRRTSHPQVRQDGDSCRTRIGTSLPVPTDMGAGAWSSRSGPVRGEPLGR